MAQKERVVADYVRVYLYNWPLRADSDGYRYRFREGSIRLPTQPAHCTAATTLGNSARIESAG